MAENLTVARPYAEAVFGIASEEKNFDRWQNMLLRCLKLSEILSILGF